MTGISAFVDQGIEDELTFCELFLNSYDVKNYTLNKFAKSKKTKEDKAEIVGKKLYDNKINHEDFLLELAKQNKKWCTFIYGDYREIPNLNDPSILLFNFGNDGWYGPLYDVEDDTNYFIRMKTVYHYGTESHENLVKYRIRWLVVCKVSNNCVSLMWDNFRTNSEHNLESYGQFQFWHEIPQYIQEIKKKLDGNLEYPLFHYIILNQMWSKYKEENGYKWNHLAIRAESSGVNLNARSKIITEVNVEGLKSLANAITKSVYQEIYEDINSNNISLLKNQMKNSILHTLIQKWGTKSYEFSLEDSSDNKLFRAHCYFGLKTDSYTQDCFPHFKCFDPYGGALATLEFLLSECNLL